MVSVLMITRNHADYLSQAIESVLMQGYAGGLELLIGEDDSGDASARICADYAQRYPGRVRCFHSPAGALGMHANFARLLSAAQGRYLAFLEGDDYWTDPHKIARQVEVLEGSTDLVLCGARTAVIQRDDSGGWQTVRELGPARSQAVYSFADMIPHYNFHFSSVVVRRDVLDLPGWVAEQYCIDRPLYLLAVQHGNAGFVDQVTSAYRQHDGGVWSGRDLGYKADASCSLFSAFMKHFPAQYRAVFRRTLSGVLWFYLSEARRAGDRDAGLRIFRKAVSAAPLHRLARNPRGLASMGLWLWLPGLDRWLRRGLRVGRAGG